MRICVNEILKKYIFSSGFDEEQDAKDACKPLCDSIDYEVTEVRVCNIVCTLVHILTSYRTKCRQKIFQYTDNDEVLTKMYRSQMNLTENIKSKAYSKINQGKMAII